MMLKRNTCIDKGIRCGEICGFRSSTVRVKMVNGETWPVRVHLCQTLIHRLVNDVTERMTCAKVKQKRVHSTDLKEQRLFLMVMIYIN